MAKIKIYEVGGSIRDRFLGVKSSDRDYSVEAPSFDAMREYIQSVGTIFLETPEFLTIRAMTKETGPADFVLCRKDGAYRDGRRPETVEPGTIYDDLARRDFTINAIASPVKNKGIIIDPFNGRQDIEDRIIRCVGGVRRSFFDDGLRMFRAFRFSITKEMVMEDDIQEALSTPEYIELIEKQEENRVREEMAKMFKADTWASIQMMHTFSEFWGRVFEVFPALWVKPTVEKR